MNITKPQKWALVISIIALISAFSVNEINLFHLKKDGIQLRENQTIVTADDYSYLFPYDNLIEHGSFYANDFDKYLTVIRSPGYGFHYGVLVRFFGLSKGLFLLKMWQLFLFAASVYCLYFLALDLLKSEKWAALVSSVYGILPISSGFLYYTLTESISPALLIIFLYFLSMAQKQSDARKKHFFYIFSALTFSYLFMTRPFLGLFGLAVPLYIWLDAYFDKSIRRKIMFLVLYSFVGLSFMLVWQIRNKMVLGKFTSLHPIYQNELPGTFRASHKAMWGFYKTWESSGANFHQSTLGIWNATMAGDTSDASIYTTIENIPLKFRNELGERELFAAFKNYQKTIWEQRDYVLNRELMPSELSSQEKTTIVQFDKLEKKIKQKFPFTNYLFTPIKVYRNLAFHSNLSLYMFQKTCRGAVFMEILRWLAFLIHVLAFNLFSLFIFTKQKKEHYLIYFVCLLFYLLYLIFVQRGIEERYTLPLLPLAILSSVAVIKYVFEKI